MEKYLDLGWRFIFQTQIKIRFILSLKSTKFTNTNNVTEWKHLEEQNVYSHIKLNIDKNACMPTFSNLNNYSLTS